MCEVYAMHGIRDNLLTELYCDVCVVGSGLAGVSAALAAAETQSVVLVSLGSTLSGSSFYPGSWGLGLIAPRDDADCENLAAKIQEVGCGMNIPELSAVLVENIGREIGRLSEWGIAFRMPEGIGTDRTLIPCFDDSYRMWRGLLYPSMIAVFTEKLKQPAIRTIAGEAAVRLICRDKTVYGVITMDAEGRARVIRSKAVVLATGGTASLFQHAIPTGDISALGHSLALQAGAQLQNLEFMQFIPAYIQPAYKTIFNERTFRFARFGDGRQSLLAPYCEQLRQMDSGMLPREQELLESRAMHGPFTSRLSDKVIDFMLYETYQKNGGTPVSFDPAIKTEQAGMMIKDYYAWLQKAKGITPDTAISIAPFFHAANGGIKIDVHGGTGVVGLFACGECSSGMHGADRIGGLSTANSLVFGRRAGIRAADYAAGTARTDTMFNRCIADTLTGLYARLPNVGTSDSTHSGGSELDGKELARIQAELQRIMYENACIIRTGKDIAAAIADIHTLQSLLLQPEARTALPALRKQLMLEGQLTVALALLTAVLERKESRGSHYRSDYPQEDPNYMYRILLTFEHGSIRFKRSVSL